MASSQLRSARQAIDRLRPLLKQWYEVPRPPKGWITTIRSSLAMPQETLGRRLGLPKQRLSQFEQRERSGDIKLSQLREVANALDCDFAYAFIPRAPLEETIQNKLRDLARRELMTVERTMQLEDQGTGIDEQRIADYIARHLDDRDVWRDG